ncbi:MAG: tRNA 4-thiouridine(8) synthase ThiI [Clostridia bacterium]|nr:tRNA 4-thiouridine(8) synthase ThiI [Clostridia bacterium]
MKKCILVRYGEIFLKGNNISYFEKKLIDNINQSLVGIEYRLVKLHNRYCIVDYDEELEDKIVKKILNVFGIHSISRAYQTEAVVDSIKEAVLALTPKSGTFRVSVNRAYKKFEYNSTPFAAELGAEILTKNPSLSVDLHHPDHIISVDIREKNNVFVFVNREMGLGGMPTGTAGNAIVMLSGGIDSPVATFKMAARGLKIFAIHYHSFPYTSEMAKQKVVDLAKILSKYTGEINLSVVSFTDIQKAIHENCPAEFMITIMRRFMMRIAEKIAIKYGCGAIITGESLGQVASQTIESINVTNSVVTMPVFRPLIGSDKTEIIDIAEKIGTYETSILPYEDCCTVFLPKFPVIKPKLEIIERAESVLDIDNLIKDAIDKIETIIINN